MDKNFDQELMNTIREHLPQEQEDNIVVEVNENQNDQTPKDNELESNEGVNETQIDLDKELSGLPKELVDTVKAFKDPEDRAKAIKIAKEQRAREDRLHLQLGNTKKELENVSGLLQHLQSKPAETFKALAKQVNFDLKQAIDEPVQDDYLTTEELIEQRTKNIEQNSYLNLQREVNSREAKELLADFLSEETSSEELIFNNQSIFVNFFNENILKLQQQSQDSYIPKKNRLKALKDAYQKLERLQPDYEDKIKLKIKQEIEEQNKNKFDEAKKQQKISKPIANSNKPLTYEDTIFNLVKEFTRANK
jgi:hypothetical protein